MEILMIAITACLINNVVLSQFLGICAFLGVSQKSDSASGMGMAVTFVLTLSSLVCGVIYKFLLVPFNVEYLKTIAFILIVAALVQFVEMFTKKFVPSLYEALGIYLPLIIFHNPNPAIAPITLLITSSISHQPRFDAYCTASIAAENRTAVRNNHFHRFPVKSIPNGMYTKMLLMF